MKSSAWGGIPLLFSFVFWASCSLVKEDRDACPCALEISVQGISLPVQISVRAGEVSRVFKASSDTLFKTMVPKGEVSVECAGGNFPQYYGASVYAEAENESLSITIRPCKHFCLLTLDVLGEEAPSYYMYVEGMVSDVLPAGTPVPGGYSFPLEENVPLCIPRQAQDSPLLLHIAMGELTLRTFSLSALLENCGYRWDSRDLEDISLVLDLDVSVLRLITEEESVHIDLQI